MFKNQYLRPMRGLDKSSIFVGLLLLFSIVSFAQVNIQDSVVFSPIVDFSYSYKIPDGDLAKRFGPSSEIGAAFFIKTKKNFLFGLDWNYMFGDEVREVEFSNGFRDMNGGVLGNNGLYSEIYFSERGFTLSAKFGKIISVLAPNPNSGFMILGGVGFIQHKIKIEDKYQEVPLLSGDNYYQGYDRLSNGILFTEFIGYRLLSNRRLVNVFGGFEFTQGITKNRREINFDTGLKDDSQRLDLQMGIRIGFSLPLYKQVAHEYYYN